MSRSLLCHFVALALCFGAISLSGKPIKLRNQMIDPANQALAPETEAGKQHGLFLIQLTGPIQPDWREALTKLGVEPLRHVPEDSFIVRLGNVPPGQVRKLPFVQWLGAYRPEHKIHRPLQGAGDSPAVSVLLAQGAAATEIAQAKQSFRKVQESKHRFGHVLRGELAPGQLRALAESDAVLWIEAAPAMKLFDEVSSDIVGGPGGAHTTTVQDLGYDGGNVTVAVADSGLHTGNAPGMHPDLAGRVDAFFY